MSDRDLQADQQPLKEQYEDDPEEARITLTATGEQEADVRSCHVDIGRAVYEAELHEGAAGPGTAACSGDLLLGALAACAQLTTQAVADAFGVDADIDTEVRGDLDLRGTLGVDDDVPVGFQDIELETTVEGDVDEETADALERYAERYCVVYQTLTNPPEIETNWQFEG
ncbi:OsmC family protein [Natribaculum luteum]|uniref:OsmC family protein n=1 Tax=Natribaculum luteum TaxID=1586232 RepID=A0ABD5NU31_9EURY|nr:OsmC family protein [Natribaculum luteum]